MRFGSSGRVFKIYFVATIHGNSSQKEQKVNPGVWVYRGRGEVMKMDGGLGRVSINLFKK